MFFIFSLFQGHISLLAIKKNLSDEKILVSQGNYFFYQKITGLSLGSPKAARFLDEDCAKLHMMP
jgi:hypothetical protein